MTDKIGYIKRDDRKKLLFISDTIIGVSGVSNVARSIIAGTAHHYNYITLGVSLDQKTKGQRYDLCQATNTEAGIEDSNVTTIAWDTYDDPEIIRQVIASEKPDGIVFITDPRYYARLFAMAHEIQHNGIGGHNPIPMCYIQIWDELPPPFYNRASWSSVNLSLCISKQTMLMNQIVLGDRTDKTKLAYFPHGVDVNRFRPLEDADQALIELREKLFKGKDYNYTLLFNSRNIQRKNISTALLAFKAMLRQLPKEEASKCCFILHTQPVDNNGTDLYAVRDALFSVEERGQIIFDEAICSQEELNLRYNLADATVIVSEAEGFGLSGLESIAAGTPIIANITGGVQDYCNFRDENDNWFTPNEEVWSNHNRKYEDYGSWVFPVWPTALTLVGSVPTPYIFSSRCDFKDVARQMTLAYATKINDGTTLPKCGQAGRDWIQTEEVGMTSKQMCDNFIVHVDDMLENWEPIDQYTIIPLDGKETLNYTEIPQYLFERN